jgi:hypothetical protein
MNDEKCNRILHVQQATCNDDLHESKVWISAVHGPLYYRPGHASLAFVLNGGRRSRACYITVKAQIVGPPFWLWTARFLQIGMKRLWQSRVRSFVWRLKCSALVNRQTVVLLFELSRYVNPTRAAASFPCLFCILSPPRYFQLCTERSIQKVRFYKTTQLSLIRRPISNGNAFRR